MFEGLQPLGAASFRGATRWIILLSGVLLFAQMFVGGWLVHWLGLTPVLVLQHHYYWQLFTYPFLHTGLFHWLFNMFIFWAFGATLERQWGTGYFLRFFFITSLGAAFCVLAIAPHSGIPTIGSSGAVFGFLVAFAMLYPDAVMYLYFIIPMKAWQAAAFFALVEFFAAAQSGGTAAARLAHLGGMLFGFLYIRFGSRIDRTFASAMTASRSWRLPRPKSVQVVELTDDLAQEVDRILEKVSRSGAESLTQKEKNILDRYTARRRA